MDLNWQPRPWTIDPNYWITIVNRVLRTVKSCFWYVAMCAFVFQRKPIRLDAYKFSERIPGNSPSFRWFRVKYMAQILQLHVKWSLPFPVFQVFIRKFNTPYQECLRSCYISDFSDRILPVYLLTYILKPLTWIKFHGLILLSEHMYNKKTL